MIPMMFGSRAAPLLGLYDPAVVPRKRVGVVLLNPVGWEFIRAHRTLRQLAARLADSGYDVLRFDYSGTGDSGGDIEDGVSVAQWLRDAESACEELTALAGVPKIVLIGIREGGLLAAELARRHPRSYLRVIIWDPPQVAQRVEQPGDSEEAGAFALSAVMRDELGSLTMRRGGEASPRSTLVMTDASWGVPIALREAVDDVISVPGSPVCWAEEQTFGLGAVPSELLGRIVEALDS